MFPGKIDAFLEYQRERREHDERTNATVLAKRRHLEEFIAKNKARASTATRARSKSQQLEKLDLIQIDTDEPTAKIRAPEVEPRKGPAVRCRDLAIGYPQREVAARSISKSTTARGRPSSETTAREKRRCCGRSSTRSSRWREKFAGATAARSASTPSTSTPACPRKRR